MTTQEFFRRTVDMLFFCTDPDCFFGINVFMILFILFLLGMVLAVLIFCGQTYYFNRHLAEKRRFIELTCGVNSHYLDRKLDVFDFIYGGLSSFIVTVYISVWRAKRGRPLRGNPLTPNVHFDKNYLKLLEEFPQVIKYQVIAAVLSLGGMLCLLIAGGLMKYFKQ
jgi:hypothetical protein